MKNLFIAVIIILITLPACTGSSSSKQASATDTCCSSTAKSETGDFITVEALFENPEQYIGETISIKGLCVHTCRHSGKRMFLQGTDEEMLIMVTAEEGISSFDKELTGSEVIATGVLVALEETASDHDHAEGEGCAAESKAKSFSLACTSFKTAR